MTGEEIRADVAKMLGVAPEEVEPDEDLSDEGLDSVRLMHLVEIWRERGVEVEFVELAERPTLRQWQQLLTGREK